MQGRQTTRSGEALNGVVAQAGEKFMSFKHTLATSPEAITFAEKGLPDMLDTAYRVMLTGEFATAQGLTTTGTYVDESTITKTGFSIVGGTGAEVAHVLIHGNVDE
jgi:hypothetical protein